MTVPFTQGQIEISTFWTGVGSRKTPTYIMAIMKTIAAKHASLGYELRSGGAVGADTAFEAGAGRNKRIYLAKEATDDAMAIAAAYDKAWERLSQYVKKLHGRNAFQVLGRDLRSPSRGLICWTPDGCQCHETRSVVTGGTGTAISIADAYGVPISNLANGAQLEKWRKWVNM